MFSIYLIFITTWLLNDFYENDIKKESRNAVNFGLSYVHDSLLEVWECIYYRKVWFQIIQITWNTLNYKVVLSQVNERITWDNAHDMLCTICGRYRAFKNYQQKSSSSSFLLSLSQDLLQILSFISIALFLLTTWSDLTDQEVFFSWII